MLSTIDTVNDDLVKYEEIFFKLIGDDLIQDNSVIIANVDMFLTHVRATSLPATNPGVVQEAYELYVLAICLDQYNNRFSNCDFYIDIYLPIIYGALSRVLHRFRAALIAVSNKSYKHISDQADTVISFSLVLYNISPAVLKLDTQQIFLKTAFIETSPYNIDDIADHYYTSLQYIYYTFIRSKTDGLIGNESLESIKKEIERTSPCRYHIYETGLRAYQIHRICNKSDTLTTISSNFDKIKSNIMTNNFLHIIKTAYNIDTNDEKTLLLKVNCSDIDLSSMETDMPIICKLLRSFHIKSDDHHFTNDERQSFQASLYGIVLKWVKRRVEYEQANRIASALAVSLSNSLSSGVYIDPKTMKKLDLNCIQFVPQFKVFIELIFDKIVQRTVL